MIYIITAFIIVSELGYDLNGLLAGLGLSGVVVALAAQDAAKIYLEELLFYGINLLKLVIGLKRQNLKELLKI